MESVQYKHFSGEVKCLEKLSKSEDTYQDRKFAEKKNPALKRTSCLRKLDPFLDEQGLLRVGGRLKNATTPYEVKHPILIPKNDHITSLLIRHYHIAYKHQGYGITHNEIRQAGCWVINGRLAVSQHVHGCVTCRKLGVKQWNRKWQVFPTNALTRRHHLRTPEWMHLVRYISKKVERSLKDGVSS